MCHQAAPPKDRYLYVLVRSDLPAGLQLAQAVHGAFEFSHTHPRVMHDWLETSNFLVVLGVPDEAALLSFHELAGAYDVDVHLVREPDLEESATALVIGPGEFHHRISHLPLALKATAMV